MKQLNWYQIFGQTHTIPDGRTVTPTDDIQIWLNCANIWDKTYTTLAEVLADTATLSALMASDNAVDYLVRSTSWTASKAIVPTMTSNTTPSGEAFASSVYNNRSDLQPWKVFDGDNSSQWASGNGDTVGAYIGYINSSAVILTQVYTKQYSISSANYMKKFKVQGYNDGELVFESDEKTISSTEGTYTFTNNTACTSYRVVCTEATSGSTNVQLQTVQFYSPEGICDNATAMTYIGQNNYCANTLLADATWCNAICNSEYFESVLNVSVPTMTSNTTPEGECIASGVSAGAIWKAFRNTYTTSDDGNYWQSEVNSSHVWIGYVFESPVTIKSYLQRRTYAAANTRDIYTVHIQSSNDGISWNNISDLITVNNSSANAKTSANFASNITPCRYYRIYEESGVTAGKLLTQVQFYGRKDV